MSQAEAVLDGLGGRVAYECAICGVECWRDENHWRNWCDDWCRRCYAAEVDGEPGRGAFRLYHLARRSVRRLFR